MKTFVKLSPAICTSLMLAMISPAYSQTPDGLTPADEDVCDPLTNATPGLYGLCVAYCEAHDAELISSHGETDELRMPDRRILDQYNRKKKESDPPMPCILDKSGDDALEECPCWTAVQLEEMMPPLTNPVDSPPNNACYASETSAKLMNYENGADGPAFELSVSANDFACFVIKKNGYTLGAPYNILGVTLEEATACRTLLENHARKYSGSTYAGVWDCFDP